MGAHFSIFLPIGSKSDFCRRGEHYASTAKRSEAPDPENATACQGLPY